MPLTLMALFLLELQYQLLNYFFQQIRWLKNQKQLISVSACSNFGKFVNKDLIPVGLKKTKTSYFTSDKSDKSEQATLYNAAFVIERPLSSKEMFFCVFKASEQGYKNLDSLCFCMTGIKLSKLCLL